MSIANPDCARTEFGSDVCDFRDFEPVNEKKNCFCFITWIAMQRLSNSVSVMQRKQSARLGSSWVRGSRPGCGTW